MPASVIGALLLLLMEHALQVKSACIWVLAVVLPEPCLHEPAHETIGLQVLLLPTVAPWRQSPKFVWGMFYDKSMSYFNVPSNA